MRVVNRFTLPESSGIDLIEAVAKPDFQTIPKLGESVTTKPDVTITNTLYPDYYDCNWTKKVGDEWEYVEEG